MLTTLDLDPLLAGFQRSLDGGMADLRDRFLVRMCDPDTGTRLHDRVRWTGVDGAIYEQGVTAELFEVTLMVHRRL